MERRRLFQALFVMSVTALVMASSATAFADVAYWSKKADMPTARWRASSGVVDGRILVLGGTTGSSYPPSGITAAVEAYDPATNTWTTMPAMTTGPRMAAGSASSGDHVYIAGGGSTNAPPALVDTIVRYNGNTGTSQVIGNIVNRRFRNAAAIVGDKLYVIGGSGQVGALDSIEVFSLTSNTVIDTLHLPAPRDNCAAVAVGTTVYIFGGWDSAGDDTDTCYALNTLTGQITTKSPMPFARFGYKGAVAYSNGLIRVQGALYNPSTDTWSTEQYQPNMAWSSPVAEVVDDVVYRIGGNLTGDSAARTTMAGSMHPTLGDGFSAVPGTGGTRSVSVGSAGTVSVVFPTATYTSDMLGVSALDAAPGALPGAAASKVFEISTTASLPSAVTITLPYTAGASSPGICHWNGAGWDVLPTTVDTVNHTVSAQSSSLSPFVVVEGAGGGSGGGSGGSGGGSGGGSVTSVPASSAWSIVVLLTLGVALLHSRRLDGRAA